MSTVAVTLHAPPRSVGLEGVLGQMEPLLEDGEAAVQVRDRQLVVRRRGAVELSGKGPEESFADLRERQLVPERAFFLGLSGGVLGDSPSPGGGVGSGSPSGSGSSPSSG